MYDLVILSAENLTPMQTCKLLKGFSPWTKRPCVYPYLLFSNVSGKRISEAVPVLENNSIYYEIKRFKGYDFQVPIRESNVGIFEMIILSVFIIFSFLLYRYHRETMIYLHSKVGHPISDELSEASSDYGIKGAISSTFRIYAYYEDGTAGIGTGFFICHDGIALTSSHVIEHAKSLKIKSYHYETDRISVLKKCKYFDIAVLKTDVNVSVPVRFASLKDISQNDMVFSIGYSYGISLMVSRGIVSSAGNVIDGILYIQTDARIRPGSSGGPLLLSDGRCIGINTFIVHEGRDIGLGFCTPLGYLGFLSTDFLCDDMTMEDFVFLEQLFDKFIKGYPSLQI